MSSAESLATAAPEVEARRASRLWWLATSALIPWMLICFVTLMALGTPNMIVTPLMWLMTATIWSYPLVLVGGRAMSALFHRYGAPHKATMALAVPAAIGAFHYALLCVPIALFPFFVDGYFALIASCLLSILLASCVVRWILR